MTVIGTPTCRNNTSHHQHCIIISARWSCDQDRLLCNRRIRVAFRKPWHTLENINTRGKHIQLYLQNKLQKVLEKHISMRTVLVCFAVLFYNTATAFGFVVPTQSGAIRGKVRKYNSEDVYQFFGIPYATPPVGDLRFKQPQFHGNWTGIRNATSFGPSCMQFLLGNDEWLLPNQNISEDCLHLNVYVPRSMNVTEQKAVMVWIHGGGFYAGQGMLIDGSYLALQGDVIVVTINYRLGLFGFLSTGDKAATGNYGLWDQHLAIKWVQMNIANFGGNSSNICIFGESAGGYSVGLHTVSPLNKGLFQRAISESGAVYSPRALSTNAPGVAKRAAMLLNCTTENNGKMVQCLRSQSAKDLLKIQSDAESEANPSGGMSFANPVGPVVDNTLVVGDPVDLLKNKNSESYAMFKTLDIMAGTNNAEGGLLYFSLIGYQNKYEFNISEGVPDTVVCDLIAPAVAKDYYNNNMKVKDAICDHYTVINGTLGEQGRAAVNIYADLQFVIPTVSTCRVHSPSDRTNIKTGSTYHYIFTHQPNYPWIQDRPKWLQGANHAGELPFVFGLDAMYPRTAERDPAEMRLSKSIMVYWSNFAKTGNPNSPDSSLPSWPAFSTDTQHYMNLTEALHSGTKLFEDRVHFWTVTVPDILKPKSYHTINNNNNNNAARQLSTNVFSIIILIPLISAYFIY